MHTVRFWMDASERAVATAAQAVIALWGASVTGILQVDWAQTGSVAGLAAATSILMSLAATSTTGNRRSASFLRNGDDPDR